MAHTGAPKANALTSNFEGHIWSKRRWATGMGGVEGQVRWCLAAGSIFFKAGRMALIGQGQVLPPSLLDFPTGQEVGQNVGPERASTACRGLLGVRLVEGASTLRVNVPMVMRWIQYTLGANLEARPLSARHSEVKAFTEDLSGIADEYHKRLHTYTFTFPKSEYGLFELGIDYQSPLS
jgi:hypothetical protein